MEEQTKNTKCGNYVPGSDTKYSMKEARRKKEHGHRGRAIYIAEGIGEKRQGRKWGERAENVLTSGEFVIK